VSRVVSSGSVSRVSLCVSLRERPECRAFVCVPLLDAGGWWLVDGDGS